MGDDEIIEVDFEVNEGVVEMDREVVNVVIMYMRKLGEKLVVSGGRVGSGERVVEKMVRM